jgi:hypothetical protein
MSDMEGGATQAGAGGSGSNYSTDTMHDVPSVQRYAAELARLTTAVSSDEKLAQQVIDAVHRGSGATVERLFKEVGVDSQVSIERTDGIPPRLRVPLGLLGGTEQLAANRTSTRTTTVTVEVGIGPISISFTVTKESDTSSTG